MQQIIFHHRDGTVEKIGTDRGNGRVETFNLAANERLIGAELITSASYFMGISFITQKRL